MTALEIKTYSGKGLIVAGATAEQAEDIRKQLGANVVTSHHARLDGWTFSRKREDRIREIVAILNDDLPGKWGALSA